MQLTGSITQPLNEVVTLSDTDLDQLPFGAIRLDPSGKVLSYNRAEASISGLDPASVIGLNFFTDVAPCTNVQSFAGRFREGVAAKSLYITLPYRFDFEAGARDVTVTLFYSTETASAWIFVGS